MDPLESSAPARWSMPTVVVVLLVALAVLVIAFLWPW
jgi:hypothetical protein